MSARRCIMGCESWPDDDAYKTCPRCGEVTQRNERFSQTLSDDEARKAKAEAAFEAWCEANGRP